MADDEFPTRKQDLWPVTRDRYYTDSCNSKRERAKIKMKELWVPPEYLGNIDELIASRAIPALQTRGHAVRDALVWRSRDYSVILSETNPVASGEMEVLARKLAIEAEGERALAVMASDQRLHDIANTLLNNPNQPGNLEAASRIVEGISNPQLRQQIEIRLPRRD